MKNFCIFSVLVIFNLGYFQKITFWGLKNACFAGYFSPENGKNTRFSWFPFANRPGYNAFMALLIPQIAANTGLPLVPWLPKICAVLDEQGILVVRSDPGSGKSTLIPLALMDYFKNDTIIMLEGRRASALSIASRLAELLGEETGERAGYAVRLQRRVSAKTRIEVITEGLLVRRIQENPGIFGENAGKGGVTLIFDEFHERSIHTDLAFALVMDLRRMGAKVRLLIMSATMDAEGVAANIDTLENRAGGAKTPVIDCPGRVFPVETRYWSLPGREAPSREWAAALAVIAREEAGAVPAEAGGDILVFLPGRREIAICGEYLAGQGLGRDFLILPLHGSLPLAEQRAVIAPEPQKSRRRIILATNVAETGLTIPGIRLVVDSGCVRLQRFHLPSGMNRLSLEPVSGHGADQRRGRAGRLGPGRCIRLWAESDIRPDETPPEIRRIDLSALVLECLLWGVKTPDELPWLERPPEAAWQWALELLRNLGAIDQDSRPSALGRKIARLGLEPRLGRLCVSGQEQGLPALACASAAILAERDGSGIGDDDPDFMLRLGALRNRSGSPWARRVRQNAEDLLRRLGAALPLEWQSGDEALAGELLIWAFPDRIAQKQGSQGPAALSPGGEGIFRFTSGREGRIRGPLARAEWLCALEVDAGERMGFIRLAVPVSVPAALETLKNQTLMEQKIEWKGLAPRRLTLKKAGRLTLAEERRPCRREELIPELPSLLRETGLASLPWEDERGAPRRLLERIRFKAGREPGEPGSWTDEALIASAAEWLGPFVWDGAESGKGTLVNGAGLAAALEFRLGWEAKQELDRLVPDQFTLPSGRKRPLDYGSGEPVLRLRLQDAFGIPGACKIISVPVVFHLLSPAGRPIQITRDLGGFWTGSYAEVRKEMRGRYPKHKWPENPGEFFEK
jgi:ATP-dependent helicase HrpB